MKKIITYSLYSLLVLLIAGCENSNNVDLISKKTSNVDLQNVENEKAAKPVSNTKKPDDCETVTQNGMTCEIVKFLQENLAWKTKENGANFCAYVQLLEDSEEYLQVLCEEYYVQDKKIICPDETSKNECFLDKTPDKKICQEKCTTEKMAPYLVTASGISVPIKLTKDENGKFILWQPRDGSLYNQDLKKNFPAEAYEALKNVKGGILNDINIRRAESHFETPMPFEIVETLDQTCTVYADCGMLPFDYAARSNCPHEMKCLNNRCTVGCYNFLDYSDFPVVKNYSWDEVIEFINSGKVESVTQYHSLKVELKLKDGSEFTVQEPEIDKIFKVIEQCGEKCEEIEKITE